MPATARTQWYLTQRFSRLALVSVGILVGSGVAMSFAYVGSVAALYGTSYGVMVLAKATMLGALLLLGGINYLLLRRSAPGEVMPRLRRLVEAEVGIGITVVLTAASLTSQPPAVDVGADTVDLPQHRAAHDAALAAAAKSRGGAAFDHAAAGTGDLVAAGSAAARGLYSGRHGAQLRRPRRHPVVGIQPSLDGRAGAC